MTPRTCYLYPHLRPASAVEGDLHRLFAPVVFRSALLRQGYDLVLQSVGEVFGKPHLMWIFNLRWLAFLSALFLTPSDDYLGPDIIILAHRYPYYLLVNHGVDTIVGILPSARVPYSNSSCFIS